MLMCNREILHIAKILFDLNTNQNIYIPAKANFYIQRNLKKLVSIAQDVENIQASIIKKYGQPTETFNQYFIPEENRSQVDEELKALMDAEQELVFCSILIDDLKDICLTPEQMQALMFMIEE